MPKIRARSRPLIPCAYELCTISFRQWRKRRFCSDPCRKNDWRARHLPYYAQKMREKRAQQKKERRQTRRYRWVQEGHEAEVPEHITVAEAIAQASPDTVAQIKELMGMEETDGN